MREIEKRSFFFFIENTLSGPNRYVIENYYYYSLRGFNFCRISFVSIVLYCYFFYEKAKTFYLFGLNLQRGVILYFVFKYFSLILA